MQQQQPQPQGTEQLGVEPQQQMMGHQTSGIVPKEYQKKVLMQLPEFVFSGPDVVQGQFQPNYHTNNQNGFTELDKQYQQ